MLIQITSANRAAAKRLLNNWHASTAVRTWPLARLNLELQRAINEGLITEQGANRALETQSEHRDPRRHESGNDGERSSNNDAKRDERDEGRESGDGNSESQRESDEDDGDSDADGARSEDGAQSNDGDDGDESDAKSKSESGAESESENEGDDESESESESDAEQEQAHETEEQKRAREAAEYDEERDGPLRHEMFPDVLAWIKSGMNVALVGPAGTGKSTIVKHAAEDIGRELTGTGAIMNKYDLIGYMDANGTYHGTPFSDAIENGKLFCFDEFDASAPDAGVAFNAATDNQDFFTLPKGMVQKHPDFIAVACMNTWGNGASADYVGRFAQDKASMSRFVCLYIDYDRRIETIIAGAHQDIVTRVWDLREACSELGIRHVVSTRKIEQCIAGREVGLSNRKLDRDVLFSGLNDDQLKQVKAHMNNAKREREARALS